MQPWLVFGSSMPCCIVFRCSERSTTTVGRRGSPHRRTEGAVVARGRRGGTRAAPVPRVRAAVLDQGMAWITHVCCRNITKSFFDFHQRGIRLCLLWSVQTAKALSQVAWISYSICVPCHATSSNFRNSLNLYTLHTQQKVVELVAWYRVVAPSGRGAGASSLNLVLLFSNNKICIWQLCICWTNTQLSNNIYAFAHCINEAVANVKRSNEARMIWCTEARNKVCTWLREVSAWPGPA